MASRGKVTHVRSDLVSWTATLGKRSISPAHIHLLTTQGKTAYYWEHLAGTHARVSAGDIYKKNPSANLHVVIKHFINTLKQVQWSRAYIHNINCCPVEEAGGCG